MEEKQLSMRRPKLSTCDICKAMYVFQTTFTKLKYV